MLQIKLSIEKLIDNKFVQEPHELQFKNTPEEVTLREYSELELFLQENQAQLNDNLLPNSQRQALLCQCLSLFLFDKSQAIILESLPNNEEGLDSLAVLFDALVNTILNCKPKDFESGKPFIFMHKDDKFAIPATYTDAAKKIVQIARNTTFQEATETIMADLKYSQVDSQGKALYKHAKFQTSLWILACLCRKIFVKNDVIRYEDVPINENEWHDLILERIQLFQDVSLEIGMQANFFLNSSKGSSKNTHTITISTMFQLVRQAVSQAHIVRNLGG